MVLNNQNIIKHFANHFCITERIAQKAVEKFGDSFYRLMIKKPLAGVGIALNIDDYNQADIDKFLTTSNKGDKNE